MRTRYVPRRKRLTALALGLTITTALLIQAVPSVFAAGFLAGRFNRMSSSEVSATATHVIGFEVNDFTILGSIEIEYCQNDPYPGTACTIATDAINGFSLDNAVLSGQTGESGFSIDPSSTSNKIILTRVPSVPLGGPSTYQFDDVINPDSVGTFYIRLRTFSSTDATGTSIQEGGIAFATNPTISVSAEVPPYLRFCAGITITGLDCSTATGSFIDLGEFSTSQPRAASSQFLVATNAAFGYSITLAGGTLTSGTNSIPAMTTQAASSPGSSQFGINLKTNSSPPVGAEPVGPGTAVPTAVYGTSNNFRFNTGDVVVTAGAPNDNRKFTVSYLANINGSQPAGVYNTTISYICLANF